MKPGGRWFSFAQLTCGMLNWMFGGSTATSAGVNVLNASNSCAVLWSTWLGSWTWAAMAKV
jgi:hypothetical protein